MINNIGLKIVPKLPEESIGWLQTELPKIVMLRLQNYIETAGKNPKDWGSHLAGNISKSLLMEDKDRWFFQTVLIPLIDKFMGYYPEYRNIIGVLSEDAPYRLETFWVNFQKENEVNPPHNHTGLFSFVIWVKIPTDWKEQHSLPISANSTSPVASNFEFHYTSMLGHLAKHTYLLDKTSEGQMVFFPAKLAHTVYPFYNCDEERISISGNINFDISEGSMKQYRSHLKSVNAKTD